MENKMPRSLVVIISSAGGLGLLPVMPGTWGTLAGVLIHGVGYALFRSSSGERIFIFVAILLIFVLSAMVLPEACRIWNDKDPKKFVLDEVVGYLVIPLLLGRNLPFWTMAIGGFFLFRIFDIIKLPGARQMDRREDLIGVMFDDIISGLYAALFLKAMSRMIQ